MSGGGGPLGGLGLAVWLQPGDADGGTNILGFTLKFCGAALYAGGDTDDDDVDLSCCDVVTPIMLPIRLVRVASCMLYCCSSEGGAEDDDDGPLPESSCCIS